MKKKTFRIYIFLSALLFGVCVAKSQTLKADYQFQGNLNSSIAGAPAMTDLTGSGGPNTFFTDTVDGYSRQTRRFPFNSGLSLNIVGLIPNNTYTFVGLFRLDQVNGFRCVAGCDPVEGSGAYIVDGRLVQESTANAPFRQNHYIQVVVVREANGTVRAYRDGTLRVNTPDPDGDFIFDTNVLQLFQDPQANASAGNIARLRVYDGPLTTTQVRALDRAANPNGGGAQSILFTSTRDSIREIYKMNSDGSNHRRLTNNEVSEDGAKWSPDGQRIVYYRFVGSSPQIWVMNADGSGQTNISNNATADFNPSWRPDGQKIVFSRCASNGVCDLFMMNPDGTGQAAFPGVNTANDEDSPSFSPDGTKITFVCSTSGSSFANQNICIANADGSNRQQVTIGVSPVVISAPIFSPDSTRIAFVRQGTSSVFSSDIFTTNLNGSSPTQLTNDNFADLGPIWSPDGQRIATSSQREEATFVEIYTMNAATGVPQSRFTTNSVADVITSWRGQTRTAFDYDGDGRADLSVFRPAVGPNGFSLWYVQRSQAGYTFEEWGIGADIPAPADYDGDGRTEIGVFRPSTGTWYHFNLVTRAFTQVQWGEPGDVPVPADHDGDGKADLVLYRPSNGMWYRHLSTSTGTYATTFSVFQFGTVEDKPQVGDFDGDGRADLAVFRPSNNTWYFRKTTDGFTSQIWGTAGDMSVPADYDGDGRSDVAVWRPSTGQWYVVNSSNNSIVVRTWGIAGDKPSAADYDGDGKTDLAVFRPSNATWFISGSTAGMNQKQFGQNDDLPTPNAFVR